MNVEEAVNTARPEPPRDFASPHLSLACRPTCKPAFKRLRSHCSCSQSTSSLMSAQHRLTLLQRLLLYNARVRSVRAEMKPLSIMEMFKAHMGKAHYLQPELQVRQKRPG